MWEHPVISSHDYRREGCQSLLPLENPFLLGLSQEACGLLNLDRPDPLGQEHLGHVSHLHSGDGERRGHGELLLSWLKGHPLLSVEEGFRIGQHEQFVNQFLHHQAQVWSSTEVPKDHPGQTEGVFTPGNLGDRFVSLAPALPESGSPTVHQVLC